MTFARFRRLAGTVILALAALGVTGGAAGVAAATELTWYGHAAFKLTTPGGRVLVIDPWIANPANPTGADDLAKLEKVDLILVTHGHGDHVGNAVEIAERTGARLVATFDLVRAMVSRRGYPEKQAGMATAGNFGGSISLLDDEVKVSFVPALHGSDIETGAGDTAAAGDPGGFVIGIKDGPTIYHTGDTDVFSDMALVNTFGKIDVMLACIGDKFTMGPERAAIAARLVDPTTAVIPMHYGTFPVLTGTPAAFAEALKREGVKAAMREMKPGETIRF